MVTGCIVDFIVLLFYLARVVQMGQDLYPAVLLTS